MKNVVKRVSTDRNKVLFFSWTKEIKLVLVFFYLQRNSIKRPFSIHLLLIWVRVIIVIILHSHIFQLLLGNYVTPPLCYGVGHADKTSRCRDQLNPKQQAPLWAPSRCPGSSSCVPEGEPRHPAKGAHFVPLHLQPHSFGHSETKEITQNWWAWVRERKLTGKCSLPLTAISPHLCLPQSFSFLLYWAQDTMLPRLHHVRRQCPDHSHTRDRVH